MQADVHSFLATTCYMLLGVILMLYVITDGFDLGVGILSLFEREEDRRTEMMAVINGVWDANETWLVLFGFVGLDVSLYPYLVPPTLTLGETTSSITVLVFMLMGIGILIPVMLVYNGYRHLVFREKL